ncbi:MAG: peptide-methionine (S)-S-oxide reductase [Alphaproteobacteria bacterium]|jgi:peptide-methionine (S)-S-oxide reductase
MILYRFLKIALIFVCAYFLSVGQIMANDALKQTPQPEHHKAVLAGGCFWGVEKLFSQLEGVTDVVNGYTGGDLLNPTYKDITTGITGHAEAVEITFDPEKISYEAVLKFFFKIHDPTTLNRQKNDIGTQYRSAIFYANAEQKNIAHNVISQGNQSGVFDKPIVTKLEKLDNFYEAEEYHQNYLAKNPYGYSCHKIRDDWAF